MCTLFLLAALGGGLARAQYDRDVFYFRGRMALSDGKFSQAIENFNILASLDTTDYWTFFFRGIAKYNLGDLRGAQKDFDTSVRLNPVFTSGYHYRAIVLSRFSKYDEALGDLERAIELRPGLIGLYFSRGVTYFLSQQFDKAVADFDKYIRKEPKDPSAYLNRGASYLFLGDTLKALNDYNKAIKLDRFDAEGFVRRGRLYAASGDYDKAISDMDHAIELDSTNTFAYFNRALMLYERQDYQSAMSDLNRVLQDEPGNALTLYNRGLIYGQMGAYEEALSDMDRVLNINPNNVLAYFNRASIFIDMERWQDALEDYDKAIELYPDFAKAYMNRSYVKNMLGDAAGSREDYKTAQAKVAEYREANENEDVSFADTTRKYSSLIALDADFAKKDFNDELLQHRDIDIRLRPMYKFVLTEQKEDTRYALTRRFEHPLLDKFIADAPVPVTVTNDPLATSSAALTKIENRLYGDGSSGTDPKTAFLRALFEVEGRQFNSALSYYDTAVEGKPSGSIENAYRAFYLMNRGVLRSDMIDFIASIENNVQVLSMDDKGTTRARVQDRVNQTYDYSEALEDMNAAVELAPDIPYIYFNLGNLHCFSGENIQAIDNFTEAIRLYPYMGDAYYNRGLVLIYLKDREKGCIDLSRAGELGVKDAYSVIKKYCEEEEMQ
ncbi:MAG: tetratricopeptide repeat protein [Bacteroidales bacterium]|nr:tetratricopeptide repeat protein [Bacteroidales bacterium]